MYHIQLQFEYRWRRPGSKLLVYRERSLRWSVEWEEVDVSCWLASGGKEYANSCVGWEALSCLALGGATTISTGVQALRSITM